MIKMFGCFAMMAPFSVSGNNGFCITFIQRCNLNKTMKLILTGCVLFIFFYSMTSCSKHGDAQPTTPQPKDTLMAWQKITGPIKSAQDIWFANPAKGIVCDTTAIYSSSDSGKTWVAAPGITNHSYFLSFFN